MAVRSSIFGHCPACGHFQVITVGRCSVCGHGFSNGQGVSGKDNRRLADLVFEDTSEGERARDEAYRLYLEAHGVNGDGYVQPGSLRGISLGQSEAPIAIVGMRQLEQLLWPIHSYFGDKKGDLEDLAVYSDAKERQFAYPRVRGPRENPYRCHKRNQKQTAKTVKRLKAVGESQGWENMRLADIVLTFPDWISEYLAPMGQRGREIAWRLFNRFWHEDLEPMLLHGVDGCLGAYVNLHTWKTEEPLKPHFHFHVLVLDKVLRPDGTFGDVEYPLNRSGTPVVFTDQEDMEVKEAWKDKLNKLARRHGLDYVKGKVDIYERYVEWDGEGDVGRARFMNRFNYQGRHPIEDFCVYSNANPDCADPPEWLAKYSNKARVYGWWRDMKSYISEDKAGELDDRTRLSPLDASEMTYIGRFDVEQVLDTGNIWTLDFIRGGPRLCKLSDKQKRWLEWMSVVGGT